MNFLKKFFGTHEPTIIQNSINDVGVIGFIYATVVFSHGWNDASETMPEQTAVILDIITSEAEIESKLNYWNKRYYDELPHHYSINEIQLDSISEIINVSKDKYRELYAHWPKSIGKKLYNQIFEKLNLRFVKFKPIQEQHKGKYVIKINESFWDIKTHNSTILVDIINTYERNFKDFELIHSSYDDAMNYGVIIMDRICNQRGPDNSYYYERAIKEQAKDFQKLPIFNFNSSKYKEDEVKAEYGRIIIGSEAELKLMKSVIEKIPNKPFEVIKIENDD